jgi:hypothetical protein
LRESGEGKNGGFVFHISRIIEMLSQNKSAPRGCGALF